MKIFNIKQANIFIQNNCIVLSCGLGNKYKTYIEFKEDNNFNILMKKWRNKQFK